MKPSSQPPRTPSGLSDFSILLFVVCLFLSGIASAAPSITLSRKSGPPTSKILVSGKGFKPNVGVDIYFDTKDEALVVTNSKGEFDNAKIHVPRSAHPGKHWVTALERDNDKGAQEPFLVQTDWSQFHFDADGTRLNPYENVLNPSNVVNLDVKWTYSAKGAIGASGAVVDGVLYIGGDHLYAIRANTGTLLWMYAANGATTDPAVADGIVYFGSTDDHVYALDARTGMPIWTYTAGDSVTSSPAVVDGVVYLGSYDGNLYALDARTGAKLWAYTTGGLVQSAPAVVRGVVYFGSTDYNVYALAAGNGALLWKHQTGNAAGDVAVRDGVVYATSQDDSLYALSTINGQELWRYATRSLIESAPAVANGVVYFGSDDDNLYALDAQTGSKLWSFETGQPETSSPAVADGVVYVGSPDGSMFALDARTGKWLWRYYLVVEPSWPTVVNGVLYFGTSEAQVFAFGLHDGGSEQEATSPPALKSLQPDFNVKASKSAAHRGW